jgi:glutamyl-tRNA reductase
MTGTSIISLENFFIAGINYKKTDVSIRGKFAINHSQYESLLQKAAAIHLQELFVVSTCNRTEIYGVANSVDELIGLLCSETNGDAQTFKKLAYIKKGKEAIEHLFSVGAGLDSQILGDYEIIGQLKQAVKFAKERNFIGTFTERLINSVLQSSKCIKSSTELSSGTVSVSFAAIQFLRSTVKDLKNKKIVLVGTGKIGRNTCKYLVGHSEATNITVMNRTNETAIEFSNAMNIHFALFENLRQRINDADIVLVSTNADSPVILKNDIKPGSKKILIDLSIPNNIDASLKNVAGITLVDVDELSKQTDETLQRREEEVPQAKAIIDEHIGDFIEWYEMRRHVPVLKAVKQKLMEIRNSDLFDMDSISPVAVTSNPQAIQKVINTMAIKLRQHNTKGCQYIEAINDYITTGINS